MMFDLRGNNMPPAGMFFPCLFPCIQLFGSHFQRPVVGFRPSGSKIYFLAFCPDKRSYLAAAFGNSVPRRASDAVNGGGIAVLFREIRQHGIQCFRAKRRGRRVIQINN